MSKKGRGTEMFFLAPFIGWIASGCLKFAINFIRFGKEAKSRIGNGGFPSTHTTVIATPVMLIGLREGFSSPVFGLGCAILIIVIIDATGLRRAVGNHAASLNRLDLTNRHRESMGHYKHEVIGGIILGAIVAWMMDIIWSMLQ